LNKKLFITIVLAAFIVIPISVYAFNTHSFQLPLNLINNTSNETIEENQNYMGMMSNYDYMNEMMNSKNMQNMNPEEHNQFIEDQRTLIEQLLQNGEITLEEATERLNVLDQMDQLHSQHHNNTSISTKGCH
jgi:maltodextrin utilization protein YvdJ